jgi:hypothetical protein
MNSTITKKISATLKMAVVLPLSIFTLSGCGTYYHHYSHRETHEVNRYYSPIERIFPGIINNNNYYSPRYHNNQRINNSINISGSQYRDVEISQSRVFYADASVSDFKGAIDGTINQVVLEDKKRFRVPVCRSVIQSVNAVNYSSFQFVNCN